MRPSLLWWALSKGGHYPNAKNADCLLNTPRRVMGAAMVFPNNDVVPRPEIPCFRPDVAAIAGSQLTAFMHYCETVAGQNFAEYTRFEQFSVDEFHKFWDLFLCWAEVLR